MDDGKAFDRREYRKDLSHTTWEEVWRRQERRAPLADDWWHALALRPGARVAEVGCGPGYFALRYANLAGPAGHVHAVDVNEDALAFLRARLDPAHHAHVTTEVLDVEEHPLPSLRFDALFLTDVLHHADEPRRALRNLRETRAPLLVAEFDPEGPGEMGPPREERLRPDDLLAMLRGAGWAPGAVARQPFEHYSVIARPG